jgi:YVTN family beta-propeller protein
VIRAGELGGVVALSLVTLMAGAQMASAQEAFVPNNADHDVSVINTATNQPVGSPIPLSGTAGPAEVAITPDGQRALVTDSSLNQVWVINVQTRAVIGSPVAVGVTPEAVAITPDGSKAYVANSGAGTVSVLNLSQSPVTVSATVTVGGAPSDVAIRPQGDLALVADDNGNTVSAIETSNNTVSGSPVAVGSSPAAIAITPDGSEAFVVNLGAGTLTELALPTLAVADTITGLNPGISSIAISPSEPLALVTNKTNEELAYVGTTSGDVLDVVIPPQLNQPEGIAFGASGAAAYIPNGAAASLAVLDVDDAAVTTNVATGGGPTGVTIVPNQLEPSFTHTSVGLAAGFDASDSTASAGIVQYDWSFGDGTTAHSPGASAVHLYPADGSYTASLELVDEDGCEGTVFTGHTANCNLIPAQATLNLTAPTGPPGPQGPAGPAGPPGEPGIAVVMAQSVYRANAGRRLRIRFASSAPGQATLTMSKPSGKVVASRSATIAAGTAMLSLKARRPGRYQLVLTLQTADNRTVTDTATLRVAGKRRG